MEQVAERSPGLDTKTSSGTEVRTCFLHPWIRYMRLRRLNERTLLVVRRTSSRRTRRHFPCDERNERRYCLLHLPKNPKRKLGFRSEGATMRRTRTRKKQSKNSPSRRRETRSSSRSSSRERSTKTKYKTVPATPWQTPKSSHRARTKNKTPKRDSSSDESSSSE